MVFSPGKGNLYILFDLIMSQSTIFQLCRDGSSWVEPVLSKDKCIVFASKSTQFVYKQSDLGRCCLS